MAVGAASEGSGLLVRAVPLGVGGDQHPTVCDSLPDRHRPRPRRSHRPATPRSGRRTRRRRSSRCGRRRASLTAPRSLDHRLVEGPRVGQPEPLPGRDHPDALMRPLVVVLVHPGVDARPARRRDRAKTLPSRNSRLSVLWNRSTLPVVVGDRGAVNRWRMPFSRQIRSNSTSPVPGPKRPVNTLPLSVRIASGTPWARIACANASHTGRAVARRTTTRRHTEPRVVVDAGHDRSRSTRPRASRRRRRPSATTPSPATAPSACSQLAACGAACGSIRP